MSDSVTSLTPQLLADSPQTWPRAIQRRRGKYGWLQGLTTLGVIAVGLLSLLVISLLMLIR
jgi:hypothetical protein